MDVFGVLRNGGEGLVLLSYMALQVWQSRGHEVHLACESQTRCLAEETSFEGAKPKPPRAKA